MHIRELMDLVEMPYPPQTQTTNNENPLPNYFHLLLVASQASEDVDRFDLRSDDPDSVIKFRKLREESLQATLALLDYSVTHNEAIKRWLENVSYDRTEADHR